MTTYLLCLFLLRTQLIALEIIDFRQFNDSVGAIDVAHSRFCWLVHRWWRKQIYKYDPGIVQYLCNITYIVLRLSHWSAPCSPKYLSSWKYEHLSLINGCISALEIRCYGKNWRSRIQWYSIHSVGNVCCVVYSYCNQVNQKILFLDVF